MDVKRMFFSGSCFFCLAQTNYIWCENCENDFIQETSRCPVCARLTDNSIVCGSCLSYKPTFTSTETLFSYQYPASDLIKAFKFQNRPEIAGCFAEKMANKLIRKNVLLPETIIPVPLHKNRQRARGYNQSLVFAKQVAKRLKLNVNTSLCSRIINTDPQSSLPMKTRRKNVKNAFELNQSKAPDHIALVDDVITTGSTINEISLLLKKAGSTRIDIWSIART